MFSKNNWLDEQTWRRKKKMEIIQLKKINKCALRYKRKQMNDDFPAVSTVSKSSFREKKARFSFSKACLSNEL